MSYVAPGWPAVYTTLRGICYAEITVRTSKTDLHSGEYGGAAPNAHEELCRLLTDGQFIGHVIERRQTNLLAVASEIMSSMTGRRYGFSADFRVVDRVSGQPRPTRTLSGGESFLASSMPTTRSPKHSTWALLLLTLRSTLKLSWAVTARCRPRGYTPWRSISTARTASRWPIRLALPAGERSSAAPQPSCSVPG